MEKQLIIILCSSRLRIHNYCEMSNILLGVTQFPILIINFNNNNDNNNYNIANHHNYISKQINHKINNMCMHMSEQMNVNISFNKYNIITHTNSSTKLLKMINSGYSRNESLYSKISTIVYIDPVLDYNYLKYCRTLKGINDIINSVYEKINILAIFLDDGHNQETIDILNELFHADCININDIKTNDIYNMFINNLYENIIKKNIWYKIAHVIITKITM